MWERCYGRSNQAGRRRPWGRVGERRPWRAAGVRAEFEHGRGAGAGGGERLAVEDTAGELFGLVLRPLVSNLKLNSPNLTPNCASNLQAQSVQQQHAQQRQQQQQTI